MNIPPRPLSESGKWSLNSTGQQFHSRTHSLHLESHKKVRGRVTPSCPANQIIWVFVGQSSSWPWEPHIRGFKLLKPVLRTQMAVFDPVFCKMYLLYRSCPRRKSFSSNFCLFPSQNDCFLQPLEGTWQLS